MPYPVFGKEFVFGQPDGSKITVKAWGNQYHSVFETLDGYTVVSDPATGFYKYAKLSDDASYLEPTDVIVGTKDPKTLTLDKHLRPSKEVAKEMARSQAQGMGSKTRWQERREEARMAKRAEMLTRGIFRAPPTEERTGDYLGLVVLIDFPDVPAEIQPYQVEDFCNKQGYTGFGNDGSVYDYYNDVSRGKLRYKNLVTSYYTAKKKRSYYTDESIAQPFRTWELIKEALTKLKRDKFDFSELSVDSKGYVYALNVFYAGLRVNNWRKGLWPHSCSLEKPFNVGKGRMLYDYQITNVGSELTLATFCHENGHMICDFPDLYDYGNQSLGVGAYCLMGFGGSNVKNPTQVCGYLKYKAGWADRVTSLNKGTFTAKADINDVFLWPKDSSEYFVVENRFKEQRDGSLPGSGLAIWHVDELGDEDNEQMTPTMHYECSLEQADNKFDLEKRKNIGNLEDLFYEPERASFSNSTKPDAKWWDGSPSGLDITDISKPGKEMHFTIL
jgi:M6 family metalloprotease-like protein